MHAVLIVLVLLMIELAVGLVLLGTWVSEGRRRAEELERIEGMVRRAAALSPGAERGGGQRPA